MNNNVSRTALEQQLLGKSTPTITHSCREHPKLKGRFHPDAPDDLQVLIHDGGPRLTDRSPEIVWVTISGCDGDLFSGRILSQPQQLQTVREGTEIKFVAPSGDHLLMVTDKYLLERPNWNIQPCNQCGLNELFDAPSDLMRVIFPNIAAGAAMGMFTSFCGICGGIQVVQSASTSASIQSMAEPAQKKWWQFWK